MHSLLQDVRYAFRSLRASRGLAAAAILLLGLGIGANTAIFSVASALLLKPLPYSDPDRLAILWNRSPGLGVAEDWFSTAQYFDIRSSSTSFDQLAIALGGFINLTGDGEPERVGMIRVSSNLLPMLGTKPLHGRLFDPSDDEGGAATARTVILHHGTWLRRFGGDPCARRFQRASPAGSAHRRQRSAVCRRRQRAGRRCVRPVPGAATRPHPRAGGAEGCRSWFLERLRDLGTRRELSSHAISAYGVIAYLVSQGTREIGIRIALGATPERIASMVVRGGMTPAAIGIAAGLALAIVVTRFMDSLLFGVDATDPATFPTIAGLLVLMALTAAYVPARRAARIDPLISLRSE